MTFRKISFMIFSVLVLVSCGSQSDEATDEQQKQTLVLNGTVSNIPDREMVYLYSSVTKDKDVIDSVMLDSGRFNFVLDWKGPEAVGLQIGDQNIRFNNIILTPDSIEMVIDPSNRKSPIMVKGSELNDEFISIAEKRKNYKADIYDALVKEYYRLDSLGDKAKQQEISKQLTDIYYERTNLAKQYVAENPNSYLSPLLIRTELMYGKNYEQLDSLMGLLGKDYADSKVMKYLNARLSDLELVKNGNVAPEISQASPKGDTLKLTDYRGKYVLIDFWASWCGPCRKENPYMVELYNKYKGDQFEVFGVSLDNNKDAWLQAIENDKIYWEHVSDLQGWGNEAAQKYVVNSIPHTVLIGPDGTIIESGLRGESLDAKLEEILNKKM
ncbi:TlpA disulfide reductase family protein [Marinigracilibium pacificum]|uniref:AhpC/TSA family protein n=1 Tax=Marinigracilibium pacificum TaxID=2729599 RepID=A0A848IY14_9BACT|nr:TlpA disulfide reductase family protein [Marinigracilibium pacificum]NMM48175.1 AhpC/TSA family protein [Marinigracilibium pacificum]